MMAYYDVEVGEKFGEIGTEYRIATLVSFFGQSRAFSKARNIARCHEAPNEFLTTIPFRNHFAL